MATRGEPKDAGVATNRRSAAVVVLVAIALSVLAPATPARAETDSVTGYLLQTGGKTRGHVSNVYVNWKSGCSVGIRGTIFDKRADGHSVTYWRKFNGFPFDSRWKKIGKATTSGWRSPGPDFNYNTHFCDSAGVWLAFCFKDERPTQNTTTRRCVVDYRKDGSGSRTREQPDPPQPDTTAPTVTSATAALNDAASRNVQYTLSATDDVAVTHRRVAVNGQWRSWVSHAPSGTIVLPDGYGRYGISFQVRDAAGNVSTAKFAGSVTRTAPVTLTLQQIDNNGNVRSCGSTEASACSDVVERFRASISSRVLPDTDLLFKAWRNIDGAWVETSTSPFRRYTITGSVMEFALDANLMSGVWRFQVQVPRDADGITSFAGSGYQYLAKPPPPDTAAPTVTGASVSLGDESSRYVQFALSAADDRGAVTQMRLAVNGAYRDWVPYASSGTIVLPDGYGRFGIKFQVMDGAGNASAEHFAGSVTRTAPVTLTLQQIDNNGNVRSCGSTETSPCSDVVKRFRASISSPVLPDTDLLFKAWRNIDGTWVETSTSPMRRYTITGWVMDFPLDANLMNGVWRFQVQVPRDAEDITAFGASGYQYLRID